MTAKGNYQIAPMGIAEALADVAEFHRTFGHPIVPSPAIPPPVRQVLRSKLLRDEYLKEFDPAWDRCHKVYANRPSPILDSALWSNPRDEAAALADMADVICDLIYYLLGTALEYGLPLEAVWQEVQRANMAKLWTAEEVEAASESATIKWDFIPVANGKHIVRDETGKVRKPPSWKEPDVKGIIRKAMEEAKKEPFNAV